MGILANIAELLDHAQRPQEQARKIDGIVVDEPSFVNFVDLSRQFFVGESRFCFRFARQNALFLDLGDGVDCLIDECFVLFVLVFDGVRRCLQKAALLED